MMSEFDLAINIYKKVIIEEPSYVSAYNNLGTLYVKLKHYQDALSIFKEFTKIDSGNYRATLGMAVAFDKIEKHANALRFYKKYLKQTADSKRKPFVLQRIKELKMLLNRTAKPLHLRVI